MLYSLAWRPGVSEYDLDKYNNIIYLHDPREKDFQLHFFTQFNTYVYIYDYYRYYPNYVTYTSTAG